MNPKILAANSPQEFSRLCGMREPRISYSVSLDTSPEAEAPVLCAVYKFVLDCHAKKEAAPENRASRLHSAGS